ncbi:hemerythrin domain-containing protein [Streptomyces armeniacus]|uniref:Hemerythrin domain-containing protein n=1 Tax=Streptomyces armeniacus TaxID=83291 RepID=A0A345XTQ4_9ACTN|nr:hemerythrin domain-containing protein [Streptomyces armeniacus]AXK35020.1 hemerythrin domain-containing protein [Streptomyces armeniacus]
MGRGGDRTLIEEITGIHRELRELLLRIDTLPFGDERFRGLVDQAITVLRRHARLERAHLFPAVRAHLVRGEALAERELADHARIERALTGLTRLAPTDPVFAPRLDALMQTVRCHFARQEEHLFPRLRDMVPAWRLRALGDEARRSERTYGRLAGPPLGVL